MARTQDKTFPSHDPFDSLGSRDERVELIREYAIENGEYNDILSLLPQSKPKEDVFYEDSSTELKTKDGFVCGTYTGLALIRSIILSI
jgi:hypothetical protein